MNTVPPAASTAAPAAANPERRKLAQAAQQFEAIFVRQMLAAARTAKPAGEDGLFGGQAMDTFQSLQDERFAQIAAERGAFGLAAAIERQLSAQVVPPAVRA
ncbi:MAG: rod-binding protein [Pseudomonadota bacterium]